MTRVILAAAIVVATTRGMAAQSNGRVTGTVVDESGGVIVGARVVVDTFLHRTVGDTTSGADGTFTLEGLTLGEYIVSADAPSFAPASVGVRVSGADDTRAVRLVLRVAGFAETVPVRVTVDRLESPPDESAAAIRTVSRTRTEVLPVRRVFDALALMPNVDVRQAGGPLGEGSITMYGISGQPLSPTATVVAVNGLPLNNGLVPETSLNLLPFVLVERFEMVQGPGSSSYGSNAVVGVLNMTTRRPTRRLEGGANVTVASRWQTGEAAAYAGGGRPGAYHWLAGFSSATTDGHLQPAGRLDFSDAAKTNVAFLGDRTFKRTQLSTTVAYLDASEHNPDVRTPNRAQRLASTRLHLNVGVEHAVSNEVRLAAAYIRNAFDGQSRETFDRAVYGFGQAAQRPSDPTNQSTDSNGVVARLDWQRRAHAFTGGSEFTAGRSTDNVTGRETSGDATGVFAHYRFTAAGDRLVVSGGYRYDTFSTYTDASHSPKAGLVWRASNRRWLARVNLSRAFSAPTFSQLFSTGFVRGNANLIAQTLWLREGGVEIRPIAALNIGLSVFRVTLNDPIFPRFSSAINATQFTNVSPGSTTTGTTITVDHSAAHVLAGGSYTYLDPDNATFHTWAHTAKAQLGYGTTRWSAAMTLRSQRGGYWADAFARPADDYTALGARASLSLRPALTVVLTGENLTDAAYATTASIGNVAGVSNNTGILMPGRFVSVGLQTRF